MTPALTAILGCFIAALIVICAVKLWNDFRRLDDNLGTSDTGLETRSPLDIYLTEGDE